VIKAAEIIIPADFSIFTTPSSLRRMTKVAIQGKNIARTTLPTTSKILAILLANTLKVSNVGTST
jgi:hypothetical protein